jgi:hypothetical protein
MISTDPMVAGAWDPAMTRVGWYPQGDSNP